MSDTTGGQRIDRGQVIEALRRRLGDDPVAREVLEAMLAGFERVRCLELELGYSPAVLRGARRRLWRHAAAAVDEIDRGPVSAPLTPC